MGHFSYNLLTCNDTKFRLRALEEFFTPTLSELTGESKRL